MLAAAVAAAVAGRSIVGEGCVRLPATVVALLPVAWAVVLLLVVLAIVLVLMASVLPTLAGGTGAAERGDALAPPAAAVAGCTTDIAIAAAAAAGSVDGGGGRDEVTGTAPAVCACGEEPAFNIGAWGEAPTLADSASLAARGEGVGAMMKPG